MTIYPPGATRATCACGRWMHPEAWMCPRCYSYWCEIDDSEWEDA